MDLWITNFCWGYLNIASSDHYLFTCTNGNQQGSGKVRKWRINFSSTQKIGFILSFKLQNEWMSTSGLSRVSYLIVTQPS
ncbi:hypothetical protein P3S67_011902 [Capsicum chacoense]